MPLPYRTILRLEPNSDSIHLAEQELQSWVAPKVGELHRTALESGAYFEPGVHQLGESHSLAVARSDRVEDGSRRLLLQFTEVNQTGTWEVRLVALHYPTNLHRGDVMIVEGRRVDEPDAPGEVDPPRIVRKLLEREDIWDGAARITGEPLLIGVDDVGEVYDAIVDQERLVSVVVAASFGREFEDELRARVRQLTSKIIGVAAVFVLSEDAVGLLNARLSVSHQVEIGRVRTYLPEVNLGDASDARRHRVLGPATFARAIHGASVSKALQGAYAFETRGALLARPLPRDIRRSVEAVAAALVDVERRQRINQRANDVLVSDSVLAPPKSIFERLKRLLLRWLKIDVSVTDVAIDSLDEFIAQQVASAETFLEEAASIEKERDHEREARIGVQFERDDLELQLAEVEDDATKLRRRVEFLQSRLVAAGAYRDAYGGPLLEDDWQSPASVVELATVLSAASPQHHKAFGRVVFTGDIAAVEELQKRDQVGRYANAFWEFVQVLYDYVGERTEGGFAGNLHMYLADDSVQGKKCSPSRHAATESDSVISNEQWRQERVFRVPSEVDPEGHAAMYAHYKPTHENTFAPRLHYYDDCARTGKVYIGYIGKHLPNAHTRDT